MNKHPLQVERELRGWSQARVAEAIGASIRTIVRWEQGAVLPQPFYRERLCALFEKNAAELDLQPFSNRELSAAQYPLVPSSERMVATIHPDVTSADTDLFSPLPAVSGEQPLHDPLLSTKFFVPMSTHALIKRTRLTDMLTRGTKGALTLLSAPAGAGKTTLITAWLTEWFNRFLPAFPPAWVSLGEEENDPVRFWLYLITAFQSSRPGLHFSIMSVLHSQYASAINWSSFVTQFLNALSAEKEPLFLVLDDYHVITDQTINQAMTYLLEYLPAHVHLIVATRTDPPWRLSHLRARGHLLEIRMEHFRVTSEEALGFFSQAMNIDLQPQMIEQITMRTEGWITGMQMLALSLQGKTTVTELLDLLHGGQRDIFDYLMEEVVMRQSATVQAFLLSTSVLDRMNAACCDAVRATSGSQEILEFLDHANLFVIPLDRQRHWYRYHHLFAQALRSRLERTYTSQRIRTLHRRASLWLSAYGSPREAIPHALAAQEWGQATDALEGVPYYTTSVYHRTPHQRWIEQLPPDLLRSQPKLCLQYALLLLWNARVMECDDWLDEAQKRLFSAETGRSGTAVFKDEQRNKLLREITITRAMAMTIRGDGHKAVALCLESGQDITEQGYAVRRQTAFYLATAWFLLDQLRLSVPSLQEAITLAQAIGNDIWKNIILGFLMWQLSFLGRLKQAWNTKQQVVSLEDPRQLLAISYPEIHQANILREWNDLAAAVKLAEQVIQRGKEAEWNMLLPHWQAILAHCYYSQGNLPAMERILQQAETLNAQLHNPWRYGSWIIAQRVRCWLARGDLNSASHWAHSYLEQEEEEPSLLARAVQDISLVRVLLATARYEEALERLDQTLQRARSARREAHVIELLVLQSLVYQATNEEQAAHASLTEALSLAQPEGYIRLFVDEGLPVANLLLSLKQRRPALEAYIDILLAIFTAEKVISFDAP